MARKELGLSLGGTLLALAVISVLAFLLSSLSVSHLHLSSRQWLGRSATYAARSAVSNGIAQIMANPDYGRAGTEPSEIRIVTQEGLGLLTFDPRTAGDEGVPYSTNNLTGTAAIAGSRGTSVAEGTIRLVGQGQAGEVKRQVEAIVRIPAFPWAVASGGRVDTENGVLVAALPEGTWPPPTSLEQLLPADMVGLSDIALRGGSRVFGDVESLEDIVLTDSEVRGEIRIRLKQIDLIHPDLKAEDYAPGPTTIAMTIPPGGPLPERLTGGARAESGLTFDHKLKLLNGYLYVEGNLVLNGGVEGVGTLVATGDIEVAGSGIDLEGLTSVAVISGGEVRLRGRTGHNFLRGFFYARRGIDPKKKLEVRRSVFLINSSQ